LIRVIYNNGIYNNGIYHKVTWLKGIITK